MATPIPRGCTFKEVSCLNIQNRVDAEINAVARMLWTISLSTSCAQATSSGQILAHSGKVGELGTAVRDDLLTSGGQGLKFSYLGMFQEAVSRIVTDPVAQILESVFDTGHKYQALRQPVAVQTYYLTLFLLTSES